MDFQNVINLMEEIKVGMNYWIPIVEYMSYYKDDINYSYNINYILFESTIHYLKNLITLNYNVCYLETTKIFVKWIGVPSYFTEEHLDYMILMCMSNLGIKCKWQSCNKICST